MAKDSGRSRRRLYRFAVQAAVVIAVVVLAEAHLRLFAAFDATRPYVRTPGWEIVFHPSPDGTPGIMEDAHIKINRLGLRGDMPWSGSSPSILTIGGSTTEDVMLNLPETWSGRLQSYLRHCQSRAWVGNAGKAGATTRQHVLQLKQMFSQQSPRIDRVVALVGLVDMLVDFHIHIPATLPADWDELQAFQYRPPEHPGLFERSVLYQAAGRVATNTIALQKSLFASNNAPAAPLYVDFGALMERYKARRRAVAPNDFLPEVPDMISALHEYRNRLNRIADITLKHGAVLTFAAQPSVWKSDMTPEEESRLYAGGLGAVDDWFMNAHTKWYTTAVLHQMLAAYNDVTLEVCGARGLQCVDLATLEPKDAAMFYDDFHFSRTGSDRAGMIFARAIGACGRDDVIRSTP